MIAVRVCKRGHDVLDATGAARWGGRWNSPGRPVVYASTCAGGAILEILVHRGRTRIPGTYHAAEILIPEDVPVERLDPAALPGWAEPESASARRFGDAWLRERRSLVMLVPSATGQPLQHNVLINPRHPDFGRVGVPRTVDLPWDARLFRRRD